MNNGMKADVSCGSSGKSYRRGQPSSLLPFCRRGHRCVVWMDRCHRGPCRQVRRSGYDTARTTPGAAGGAEAAQSTWIDGLSLKRDKTKTSIMFRPLLLWVFCQRRLKPKLNVKAILERKMSPPSFFEYLAVSPPCPNKSSSPHVQT